MYDQAVKLLTLDGPRMIRWVVIAFLLGGLFGMLGGCVGRGTEWEHTSHSELQRTLKAAQANTDTAFDLVEEANDQAMFDLFADASADFDLYLERHPNADPAALRQWFAEAVALQSATLSTRLEAADTLRENRTIARENLDAALRLSEQLQAVNLAQQAFAERFKTAMTQIESAATDAMQRRAERKAQEAAEKKARRQQLQAELVRSLTTATSRPAGGS